ncbi:hypothetical protein [Arenimonas oryziterrae]|uniref:DUF5666 domain-containing protein n=1 Tax=Arenimonas oryziterrae DSM 21050 = YC6267 TaxID=1121015 RepID=A0A091AM04_9GAMM|nr:hypothetical protein [Arenimonas oryziterrae]KFN41228.1 hypothetical protein N789_04895 [Arenimonas oryziterrae DSM 21050 = YC6267]
MAMHKFGLFLSLLALTTACAHRPAGMTRGEEKFSGVVEKVDTGCFADGMCYMQIDGRRVVFGMGWSRETWGQVAPLEPIENYVGKRVDVFCKRREGDCWLAGSAVYYIRPSQ